MPARFLSLLATILLLAAAHAQTLVVYPLTSRDSFLGTALAERLAVAFDDEYEVYGPAVAPSLVPPLPVSDGFVNPTEFLRGRGVADRVGSRLLRDSLGADAVITGTVDFTGEYAVARLYLATDEGVDAFLVRAPADAPGRLASQAVRATAARLGRSVEPSAAAIDLSDGEGELAQVLTLVAAGLVDDARRTLERMASPGVRARELLEALHELERGGEAADPALLAVLALNRQPLDERLALRYFRLLADERNLPAADLWVAVLEASLNDVAGAETTFGRLPGDYGYGQAARAAFLASGGSVDGAESLAIETARDDSAALLAVAVAAESLGDTELEKEALVRLGRVAPYFAYPFERRSFIAFDEDDAQTAAETLAVAVELEPESDLYWTNLGWAYYLLGRLEASEEASITAVTLDASQYVAHYNLGLVRVVTGRLEEGVSAYLDALRFDPEVDDAAVEDLEQALELYPEAPEIHYALAMLYEAEGRRAAAAEQYALFAERAQSHELAGRAMERVEVLTAPPPPIELTDGLVRVRLGERALAREPFHPGDPLYPSFEVYTPGEELPGRLEVTLVLSGPDGQQLAVEERTVEVPTGAIGYVIDDVELALPRDLAAGIYRIDVEVMASEDRAVAATAMFNVRGEPQPIRQLLGRNVVMHGLDTGARLYGSEHLSRPELLETLLLRELERTADAAEEVLPVVESGRFAGMSGGELFTESSAADVADFVQFLLASGVRDTSFVFAEAYAQWALEGAPLEGETAGE